MCIHCEEVDAKLWCKQCDKLAHTMLNLKKHTCLSVPFDPTSIIIASCYQHPAEKLQFWCNNCLKPVCLACIRLKHQDHVCDEIKTELSNKINEQQDCFTKMESIIDQVMKYSMDRMTVNEHSIIDTITKTFDSIRSIITKYENELKEKIYAIDQRNKDLFDTIQNQLRRKQEKLSESRRQFAIDIVNQDYTQLFLNHQKSMNYLKKTTQELNELKHSIKTKYCVTEIDRLEQTISDTLQRVCICEEQQDDSKMGDINQLQKTKKQDTTVPIVNAIIETKAPPLRGATRKDIPLNIKWYQNRVTVAGGNRQGNKHNQLSGPSGLFIDDDETIYLTDANNHRVMKWKCGAKRGYIVAGGIGKGSGAQQLNRPYDVIVDKKNDSLIISDNGNLRVVRWSLRQNTTRGETLISNISCAGLTMDENGFLYVVDEGKHEVRRYQVGDTNGTLVAGGHGKGNRLDQLCEPWYIFVDENHSVYVSDWGNHRVVKWEEGAKQGIVVAGGQGKGNSLRHLPSPEGVVVDHSGTVYVADSWNDRVMCWPTGATQGNVIIGRHRVSCPIGLSFDRDHNLYVVDWGNHRIQRFSCQ